MSNKRYYVFVISFLLLITLIGGVYGLEEMKIKQADNLVSLDEMSVQERIGVLNQKIKEKNLSWVAGETSMSKLSKEERRARLGFIKPPFQKQNAGIETNYVTYPLSTSYPSSLDWRNKDGNNWISPIKDQIGCGSCWAFAGVGVLESKAKIDLNNSGYSIDLSEQDGISCNTEGYSCSGGWASSVFNLTKNTGIVKESCFSYTATNNSCSNKCSGWQNQVLKINDYKAISASPASIKHAINDHGPVTVYMGVYEDFYYYKNEIYKWTYGGFEGYHEILIVGFNDSGSYWICKNSWGTGWGENGYFRISYDENVLDWYVWNPSLLGEFFLDGSQYITSTDIGTIPTVNSAQANITYANSTIPINFSVYAKGNSIKNLTSVEINGTTMSGTLSTGGIFSTIKNLSVIGCYGFEGICVLTINATDDAGKANTNEKITVMVDDLAPRVTANPTVYPVNQNATRNGSLITLNATINDLGTGVNATVNASQVNGSLRNIILDNISGFYTNSTVIVNISDGTYRLNVTAFDNVGNKNDTVQISVIVDNTPPSNITINPISYQRGSAANNRSIIGFNASADDPVINLTSAGLKNASVNASLINNTGRIELTNQSGIWRGNATFDKLIPPDDGNYSLNVTFFDYAGNLNDSAQINITIDNTPPSVTEVSLTSLVEIGSFTNISANITDNFELNTTDVYLLVEYPNGSSRHHSMTMSNSVAMNNNGGEVYFNFTDTAQYGRYNITIIANDTTGNTNNSEKTWFVTTKSNSSVVLIHGGGRGETAYGPDIWNRSNFTGLVAEETLNVQNVSGRDIPKMNLWYNTTKQIVRYKVNEANSILAVEQGLDSNGVKVSQGGYYAKIGWQGIPYVAFNGKADKISRLILEQGLTDSKTLTVKETWDMGEGFSLKLQGIDANATPKQAWLALYKNATRLDDKVVFESAVYTFINSTAGESNVPIFVTYADNISETSIRLKYTWLISDIITNINAGDLFGNLKVTMIGSDFINLTNDNTAITLSHQNSNIYLMDDLYFGVANNTSLEYYPFFQYNEPTRINATENTDVYLEILTNSSVAGSFKITKMTDVPAGMNRSFGLTPFGKYISINSNMADILNWALIKIYYTEDELIASGLDENSLRISWHNESSNSWELLAKGSPSWVNDAGVSTANLNNYSGYVWANLSNLSTFAILAVPPVTTTTTSSSSGSGGGGGGGGTSGENYTNIEVKEKYYLHIFKDKVTSYRFTNRSNPVMFVNITGNISAGEINAAVEVLRNTSTLIKPPNPAPGIVYKNVNIWVGTTGFAVPKNIKTAVIRFKVLNMWLESNSIEANEIRMVRWDGSKWVTLHTGVMEKDSTNTYYEATTDTFSPFTITGLAHAVVVSETPTKQSETAKATAVPAKNGIPGFEATIAISVIALLAASLRNDRKRR